MNMYNPARERALILEEINKTIDLLYVTHCRSTKNTLLNRLRSQILRFSMLTRPQYILEDVIPVKSARSNRCAAKGQTYIQTERPVSAAAVMQPTEPPPPAQLETPPVDQGAPTAPTGPNAGVPDRVFTLEGISQYDGRNGRPAFVAVDGVVYDVTDHPAWALGTHFGLKAGLDQTSGYISCHTGQGLLQGLKPIGRIEDA